MKKLPAVCLDGDNPVRSQDAADPFHESFVDHLSFFISRLVVAGIRKMDKDPADVHLPHHRRNGEIHVPMKQNKVRKVSIPRKERLCDFPADVYSYEKDLGVVLCETCQQFSFAAPEVKPYVSLTRCAIGRQPIGDADGNSALERIRMPPNSIAHTASVHIEASKEGQLPSELMRNPSTRTCRGSVLSDLPYRDAWQKSRRSSLRTSASR